MFFTVGKSFIFIPEILIDPCHLNTPNSISNAPKMGASKGVCGKNVTVAFSFFLC